MTDSSPDSIKGLVELEALRAFCNEPQTIILDRELPWLKAAVRYLLSELEAVKGERDDAIHEARREIRQNVDDGQLRSLLARAHVVAGHPADSEDQSNDAMLGRMFIAARAKVEALLARTEDAEASLSSLKEEVREVLGPFAESGKGYKPHTGGGWYRVNEYGRKEVVHSVTFEDGEVFHKAATLYAKLSDGGGEG